MSHDDLDAEELVDVLRQRPTFQEVARKTEVLRRQAQSQLRSLQMLVREAVRTTAALVVLENWNAVIEERPDLGLHRSKRTPQEVADLLSCVSLDD